VILCDDIIELLALVPDKTIKSKKVDADNKTIGFRKVKAKDLQKAQQAIKTKLLTRYKNMHTALRAIDGKGDGYLSREEVYEMLKLHDLLKHVDYFTGAMHGEVTMAEADTLMDYVDTDKDGKLSYNEFQRVLTADNILHIPPPKNPAAKFGQGKWS
jgi:Ca2+-binding EF-hand superfamily protein